MTTKVYRTSTSAYKVYYGNSSVSTGFEEHIYGDPSTVLGLAKSMSHTKTDSYSLNLSVDLKDIGLPLKFGGSYGSSNSTTFGATSSASRTIQKYAKTGYFSYNVMLNLYRYYVKNYETSNPGRYETFGHIYGVRDPEPYRQLYYSPTSNYTNSKATKMTESNKKSIFGIGK